jgi:cell division protein FtsW
MKLFKEYKNIDIIFLILFGLLLLAGIIIFQTASSVSSYLASGNPYMYFKTHIIQGILPGVVIFGIVSYIPYFWYKKLSVLGYIIALGLNLLIFIPGFGKTIYGATRWVSIAGFDFQASELLKIALLLYIAALLSQFKHKINSLPKLMIVVGIVLISVALVVVGQSNLSTGILLFSSSAAMIYHSELHKRYIFILGGVAMAFVFFAIVLSPYRLNRINTFLEGGQEDMLGSGYQIEQSLIAVGSGGLFGVGWNQSRQKFKYLPESRSDSIFAIFSEEAGFVGVSLLVGLFAAITFRIIWLSTQVSDTFAHYILIGGATWFMMQVFVNIGSTIRLIPVTGIPLPFISGGNTSIWVLSVLFGIIANISKYKIKS